MRIGLVTKLVITTILVVTIITLISHLMTRWYLPDGPTLEIESSILILLALLAVLVPFFRKQVVTPITRLTNASHEMERGFQHWIGTAYLSKSISMNRGDEISELATSFNHMVKVLGEKEKIRSILGKVVSEEVAEELLVKRIRMEGEERSATIMFVDIRNFTSLSERMQPTNVLSMLNICFTKITDIIEQHHGIVDKYIGDSVMAIFGVPLESTHHGHNALVASLEIINSLKTINKNLANRGLPLVDVGIGINTGPVVAGNIGSEKRMNYTVIGDSVNLASRLQELNREYGTHIIVGETTKNIVPEATYRPIGQAQIKGRNVPVSLYELTGII